MTKKYSTDAPAYSYADSGCPEATDYLGEQSHCYECPFPRCVYESGGKRRLLTELRNMKLLRLWRQGKDSAELSDSFNLSLVQVNKIISEAYGKE